MIEWQPKILGIMQSSVDKTIQIAFNGNDFIFTGKSMEIPYYLSKSLFTSLTVHEILEHVGIERNPNAGI